MNLPLFFPLPDISHVQDDSDTWSMKPAFPVICWKSFLRSEIIVKADFVRKVFFIHQPLEPHDLDADNIWIIHCHQSNKSVLIFCFKCPNCHLICNLDRQIFIIDECLYTLKRPFPVKRCERKTTGISKQTQPQDRLQIRSHSLRKLHSKINTRVLKLERTGVEKHVQKTS